MSFFHNCEYVSRSIPRNLISKKNLTKLLKSASNIYKSIPVDCFIFESCLTDSEANLDLNFLVDIEELNEFHNTFGVKEFISNCKNNSLNFIEELLKRGVIQNKIPGMWIVFDLRSSPVFPPQPNLYFMLGRGKEREEIISLINNFHYSLKQEKISTGMADLLPGFFSNNLNVTHLGFMLARPTDALRICLTSRELLSTDSYISYLNNIGIHGFDDSFASILDKLRRYIGWIEFIFDIKDRVQGQFGFSFSVTTPPAEAKKSWACIINILAAEGLIHKKKQNGLLEWCGYQLEAEICSDLFSCFYQRKLWHRTINHMKIVFSSQKPIQAKAYLQAIVK
jgi:hypothetical protein